MREGDGHGGFAALQCPPHHKTLKGRGLPVLPRIPKLHSTGPGTQNRQNTHVKKRKWDKDMPGEGNTGHKGTEPLCAFGYK